MSRGLSISDTDDDDVEDGHDESGTLFSHTQGWRNPPRSKRKGRKSGYIAICCAALILCFWAIGGSRPWARSKHESTGGPQRALIIASYAEQNVTWLRDVPKGWQIYRYVAKSPSSAGNTLARAGRVSSIPLQFDVGREAMAYLTFIIDHYNLSELPSYMVFMHGHDRAWHQPERAVDKLRALNLTSLRQHRYVPIRCSYDPTCAPEGHFNLAAGPSSIPFDNLKPLPALWETCFGVAKDELPTRLASPQGAQFAVTADAVRAQPLEFWKRVRAPLLQPNLKTLVEQLKTKTLSVWGTNDTSANEELLGSDNKTMTNEDLASMYDRMWHVFFGKDTVTCLTERECRGTVYANALACSRYEATPSQDWENVACAVDEDALKVIKLENDALLKAERS